MLVQVILSGHVPPASYYQQCYDRFAEISLAYQDTIVASVFGHSNVDHYTYFNHASRRNSIGIQSAADLPSSLETLYNNLPKDPNADDYSFSHVAPSVIPTFQPAYRIWTYNTSLSDGSVYDSSEESILRPPIFEEAHAWVDDEDSITQSSASDLQQVFQAFSYDTISEFVVDSLRRKRKSRRRKKKKKKARYEPIARHVSPTSPSRTNRFATVLGYVQYYLPLDQANLHSGWGKHKKDNTTDHRPMPKFEVEYTTFTVESLVSHLHDYPWPGFGIEDGHNLMDSIKKRQSEWTPYGMPDLTISSWLNLTERLSEGGKTWNGFADRMFVQTRNKK